jgi:hypothetical protein
MNGVTLDPRLELPVTDDHTAGPREIGGKGDKMRAQSKAVGSCDRYMDSTVAH